MSIQLEGDFAGSYLHGDNSQIVATDTMKNTVYILAKKEGVAALESGKVDAFASDKLLLAGAKFKDEEAFTILPDDLSIEQYAIVVPRGDWALRLAVNTGLARIFRGGRTKELFERWFFGARPGLLLEAVYALGRIAD